MGANNFPRAVQERQLREHIEKKRVGQRFSHNSEKEFLLMRKKGCVPDPPGHWVPPNVTMKAFESLLNWLKQTQNAGPLKFCARFPVLRLPSAVLLLPGTRTAGG